LRVHATIVRAKTGVDLGPRRQPPRMARMPSWVIALPAMPFSVRIAAIASSGIQIGPAPVRCNMIPSG